jgi:hypothetical protein
VHPWKPLRREGVRVARCTVRRLMREMGLQGAVRGRAGITTTRPTAWSFGSIDTKLGGQLVFSPVRQRGGDMENDDRPRGGSKAQPSGRERRTVSGAAECDTWVDLGSRGRRRGSQEIASDRCFDAPVNRRVVRLRSPTHGWNLLLGELRRDLAVARSAKADRFESYPRSHPSRTSAPTFDSAL